MNSALHDVAGFDGPARQYRKYGWKTAPSGSVPAGGRPAGHVCGARPNVTADSKVKFRAVAQYMDALERFSVTFRAARTAAESKAAKAAALAKPGKTAAAEGGSGGPPVAAPAKTPPRVFWMFHGYRPASVPTCYANQLDRMLCLQAVALRHVEEAGIQPMDFATLQQDAPASWFDDTVHVGRSRSTNGLELMTLQVMLNTLCTP